MDVPAGIASQIGLAPFVILTLVTLLGWIVRMLFTRGIVPASHHAEIIGRYEDALTEAHEQTRKVEAERDEWRDQAKSMAGMNAELLTNQDLTLSAWNSIKAYVAAKEG